MKPRAFLALTILASIIMIIGFCVPFASALQGAIMGVNIILLIFMTIRHLVGASQMNITFSVQCYKKLRAKGYKPAAALHAARFYKSRYPFIK